MGMNASYTRHCHLLSNLDGLHNSLCQAQRALSRTTWGTVWQNRQHIFLLSP